MSNDYNPFQSPEAPMRPDDGPGWTIMPFQSGHQRANVTVLLLGIIALIYLLAIVMVGVQYASLEQQPNGNNVFSPEGAQIEVAHRGLAVVETLVAVALIIAFSMWTHRAARNLPSLGGRGLKYTPAWAVGWFFVPFANIVMPYFVAAEIWRESDPEQKYIDGQRNKTTSPLILCWWVVYLARSAPGLVYLAIIVLDVTKIAARQGTPEEIAKVVNQLLPSRLLVTIAAEAIGIIAAILAILYVRGVDANQEKSFDRIHGQDFAA